MLLNCNSCQKKFIVPDSAITKSGRLVQCGSCGNKWTQIPIRDEIIKKTYEQENTLSKKTKTIKKTTKIKKNLYTVEYLRKKHGLVIDGSDNKIEKKLLQKQKKKSSFGFYSYVVILFVFFASVLGLLNLTKEILILQYPSTEIYIYYLYEVIEIIEIFLIEFINQFNN